MTTLADGQSVDHLASTPTAQADGHRGFDAMGLAGKTVIVTGAASGIGRATTAALGALGASVVAVDRDAHRLAELTELPRAQQDKDSWLVTVTGDLRDAHAAERATDRAVRIGQRVAGAVLCAGSAGVGTLASTSDADFADVIDANLTVHFPLTRRLLQLCAAGDAFPHDGCSLVYVVSKHATAPSSGFGAYPLAKAAQQQLARLAAIEGAPYGLRANVVNPGAVFQTSNFWTPELKSDKAAAHHVPPAQLEQFYANRTLLGVAVTPDDVSRAVIFFLSPWSRAMTGCYLAVDGGLASTFAR